MSRAGLATLLDYLAAAVALAMVWQLAAAAVHSPLLPSPGQSLAALAAAWRSGTLAADTAVSTFRVVAGMVLAVVVGLPLGLLMGRSARLDRVLSPVVYLVYPIPKVAFLPVIMVLLGLGDLPKIVLIALIVVFQVVVAARDAARQVPPAQLLSLASLGATRWQQLRHVVIPSALPKLFTTLRVALGTAIAVLFLSEMFATNRGLGYFLLYSWTRLDYPAVYAGVLALGGLGLLLYWLVDLLDVAACGWTRRGRAD